MLHGHAKIELTNVKTGEKQVIEHDNMLTNYWRDMLTPRGMIGRNICDTGNQDEVNWDKRVLFGGILLFENSLDNDADNYKFPHNNKMVARGSNIAYSGVDTTLGSFNSSESVIGTDSATFVWDWTQERGNGTISALGLTSTFGGLMGSDRNDMGDLSNDVYVPSTKFNTPEVISQFANSYKCAYIDEEHNKCYAFISSGARTITVREYNFPYNEIDLLTTKVRCYATSGPARFDNNQYTQKTVDLSAYTFLPTSSGQVCFFTHQGKLWIRSYGNWSNGSVKQFVRYDFKTGAIDTVSVTNNTGKTIWDNYVTGERTSNLMVIHDGCLYAETTDYRVVYINLSDNTDCGVVVDGSGNEIVKVSNEYLERFMQIWGETWFTLSQLGYYDNGDNNIKTSYIIASKGVAKRRNMGAVYRGTYETLGNCDYNQSCDAYGFYCNDSNYSVIRTFNLMCLATKNNLQTPVTKTADMTMRVTYTIQEVSE